MNRRTFIVGAGCAVTASYSGCVTGTPLRQDVTESRTKTYDITPGTTLGVDNQNGSVTVEGYDGDAVEVDVTVEAPTQAAIDGTAVTTDEASDTFQFRTEYDDSVDEDDVTVSLTIRCPEDASVGRIGTVNGSVEVTDVAGDATLESTNGNVTARNVDGAVALRTSNGSVTAREIEALRGAKTDNAGIGVDVPALVGDTRIQAKNGNVDAALAADLDAAVTATTTNGSLDVEGPAFESADGSKTEFSGTLGDGTHDLEIATTNGAIELTALSA